LEATATNLLHDPSVAGIILNARDVTERRQFEKQLQHQAFHDSLTGLPNRALLQDRIAHALARSRRQPQPLAVLFLDLDAFKSVNDSLGHATGDTVLQAVAERLRTSMREEDTVARIGGDEFAILLEGVGDEMGAQEAAARALAALVRPLLIHDRLLLIRASVGVALSVNGQETVDDLLRNADLAMYAAKTSGKGRYQLFEPDLHRAAVNRLLLEQDLRVALERQEFVVHYQPIVALIGGQITGVEALVRWRHPERGLVEPDDFIPLAEETGLILPIGRWVLREACTQGARWHALHPHLATLEVSVNLSVKQLEDADLVAYVHQVLTETGLAPERLLLELTESALMQDAEGGLRQLRALKALGVRLAIDDFGTGYSSLSYLRQFPVDMLKIDKSFVASLSSQPGEVALVRAMLRLGHSLNLRVLAEGIEMPEQAGTLQDLQCELGQGYYFAKPAPARDVERLLCGPVVIPPGKQQHAAAGATSQTMPES
jgi:diguanylate cyclase (GGDEF)-like protein